MSLASRFPLVLKSNHDPLFKEVLNPDDTVEWQGMKSKQPTLNQRPMMIQEIECNEHRVLNSNESSVSNINCTMPKNNSSCNYSDNGGTGVFDEYWKSERVQTTIVLFLTQTIMQAQANGERVQTPNTMDSADWEAVRLADVKEVAHTIRDRGMNNVLAERIKVWQHFRIKNCLHVAYLIYTSNVFSH